MISKEFESSKGSEQVAGIQLTCLKRTLLFIKSKMSMTRRVTAGSI